MLFETRVARPAKEIRTEINATVIITFSLDDQHRVTVAEKPVFSLNRLRIDFSDPRDSIRALRSKKRRNEAEQGGSRLVKVGDQRIHAQKLSRWVNEKGGLCDVRFLTGKSAGARMRNEIVFDRTNTRGSHRDSAAVARFKQRSL